MEDERSEEAEAPAEEHAEPAKAPSTEVGRPAERPRGLAARIRRADRSPGVVKAARATRELLPGEVEDIEEPSSAAKELALSALQVWQALTDAGPIRGERTVAILFTDIVEFSSWALREGDEAALELLEAVAGIVEPTVRGHGGKIVKRLGDGHMAVFRSATAAVDAALEIQDAITEVEVEGHRPKLRAGVHAGQPQRVGSDYLGVDVNVAARVADAARGGEVLISGSVLEAADAEGLEVRRRRFFRAKGAPRDLEVYSVSRPRRAP